MLLIIPTRPNLKRRSGPMASLGPFPQGPRGNPAREARDGTRRIPPSCDPDAPVARASRRTPTTLLPPNSLLTDKSMYPPSATRFPRRVALFFALPCHLDAKVLQ